MASLFRYVDKLGAATSAAFAFVPGGPPPPPSLSRPLSSRSQRYRSCSIVCREARSPWGSSFTFGTGRRGAQAMTVCCAAACSDDSFGQHSSDDSETISVSRPPGAAKHTTHVHHDPQQAVQQQQDGLPADLNTLLASSVDGIRCACVCLCVFTSCMCGLLKLRHIAVTCLQAALTI